jgi:ATP-dependent protease ClpP protease subunit
MKILVMLTMLLTASVSFAENIRTILLDDTNAISFNQSFSASYVSKKQVEAIKLCNVDNKEIYIVLYSPGGSVTAGQLFTDTLKGLPCTFHTISIFSGSMSFITSQVLNKRLAIPSAVLMSHRASIGNVGGSIGGSLDAFLKLINDNITEIEEQVAKRANMSLTHYRKIIGNDLWMTSNEAKKLGFIDEVVNVKCDKSLMLSYTETVYNMFGSFDAEFSRCPLITAPILVTPTNGTTSEKVVEFINYYNNIESRIKTTE